jgi:hypothetical protein
LLGEIKEAQGSFCCDAHPLVLGHREQLAPLAATYGVVILSHDESKTKARVQVSWDSFDVQAEKELL